MGVPSKKYDAIMTINNTSVVINANGINIPASNNFSRSEMNGIALIGEILHRLRTDKSLDVEVPNEVMIVVDPLVMCEWLDSGNLKIHQDRPTRKWKHCSNEVQAIAADRSFTCSESLSKAIPKSRTQFMVENARLRLGFTVEKDNKDNSDEATTPSV